MDISQFTGMMQQRNAQQIIITPDAPLQILCGGRWQQTTLFTPNGFAISRMMKECVPPNLQGSWRQENVSFSFPYVTAFGNYEIEVKSVASIRTVTITDTVAPLDASPPAPPSTAVPSAEAFTSGFSSSLTPPPLKASSQMAREMGKGNVNVNIFAPPMPAASQGTSTLTTNAATVPAPRATAPTDFRAAPPLTNLWYHAASGQQVGPVQQINMEQCIAANIVRPDTMVWRDGMPDWTMAKLTELSSLFSTQPPPISANPITGDDAATGFGLYGGLNSSGQGWDTPVPPELNKGFNGGAFLLTPFWCCAHGVWYLGLLYFVTSLAFATIRLSFLSLVLSLIFGAMGNRIAWQNRRFATVEDFSQVQRIWTWVGIAVAVVFFVIGFGVSNSSNSNSSNDYSSETSVYQ